MIYISVKNKKILDNIIEIFDNNELKFCYDNDDMYSLIRKSTIVVTDSNPTVNKFALKEKKQIIILTSKEKMTKLEKNYESYTYVYCCNKEEAVLDLVKCITKRGKRKKLIIGVGIILIILLLLLISSLCFFKLGTKEKKVVVENKIDYRKENIVFIGDSITELYDLDKHYKNLPVINTGKSGYKTMDIYDELYDRLYIYNPTKVFLLIGTNDFFDDRSNEYIVGNIKKIVNDINDKRPNAKVYLESIYPVNNSDDEKINKEMVYDRDNKTIKDINKELKKFCDNKKVCTYIDIYNHLLDDDGNLKLEYTRDGLHVSDEAYNIITDILMPYIKVNNNN